MKCLAPPRSSSRAGLVSGGAISDITNTVVDSPIQRSRSARPFAQHHVLRESVDVGNFPFQRSILRFNRIVNETLT
jgi:hypothetical protein